MKPYSDDHMIYDTADHRYRLTELYVLQRMNRNLSAILADHGGASDTANEAGVLLDRISRQIYAYCLRSTPTPYKREQVMATDHAKRVAIRDAMAEQLVYVLNNGDLSAYTGVNLDTGATIDPNRMRMAEIAPMARDILITHGLATPTFSLLNDRDITPRYSEEGY